MLGVRRHIMNAHYYLAIFVKLFATILIIVAVPMLVQFSELYYYDVDTVPVIGMFGVGINGLIYLLLAIILWKFPLSISKRLLSPELDTKIVNFKPEYFLTVIILGIGIYYLFFSLSDSVYWVIYSQFVNNQMYGAPVMIDYDARIAMWVTGVELAMAIFLVFRAKTIANQLLKVSK